MVGVVKAPESVTPTDGSRFVADVEAWLRAQTHPDVPPCWVAQGGGRVSVRSAEHLALLVATLVNPGSWGILEHPVGSSWAQAMRVLGGWIVEVDGGSGPDAFARRVRRAAADRPDEPSRRLRCTNSHGGRAATYFHAEVFSSPRESAQALWAWLHGGLPGGCELRVLQDGID